MIAMIISAVVAAVQGIGGPSEQTADIECVYEYRTSDDKGRKDVYSTILQVGRKSAKFVDYSTFQLDSARTSGASEDQVEAFRLREEKKFDTPQQLKDEIEKNIAQTREYFRETGEE